VQSNLFTIHSENAIGRAHDIGQRTSLDLAWLDVIPDADEVELPLMLPGRMRDTCTLIKHYRYECRETNTTGFRDLDLPELEETSPMTVGVAGKGDKSSTSSKTRVAEATVEAERCPCVDDKADFPKRRMWSKLLSADRLASRATGSADICICPGMSSSEQCVWLTVGRSEQVAPLDLVGN